MDTLHQPLSRVAEAMQDFVQRKELRLLHVVTTGPLRLAVLEHIAAAEHLGANRSLFFVLEAPCEAEDTGWTARTEELREDVEALRERLIRAEEGIALPPACAVSSAAETKTPYARFGIELRALVEGLRAPLEGVVIVLAPLWLRAPKKGWVEEVAALTFHAALAQVRWVIVHLEDAVCLPVVQKLGRRGQTVDARVDAAAASAEAHAMLAAIKASPQGAAGAQLSGAAGPRQPPPARKNKPAALTAASANDTGVPEGYADVAAVHRLRTLILGGAQSMRDGDAPEAVRQQREAERLCLDAGLARESVVMALVLGGYAVQGGAQVYALNEFRRARQSAEVAGFAELAVQAQVAVAASLLAQQRTAEATAAYIEAGQLGAALGSPILAIESYRMAGQLLAASGMAGLAAGGWQRALDLADGATPLDRKASTAAEVARALAALCRTHRLDEQAVALEAQAVAMGAPLPVEPPPPPQPAPLDTGAAQNIPDPGART